METPRPPFNSTSDHDDYEYYKPLITGDTVYISIISCLEIPMICLSIYAVFSLIKSKQAAPIFVMNLLISDVILIVCMLILDNTINFYVLITAGIILTWAGFTGLYFTTCIAIERYILIAHPIWHRSHRSVKCLVCTSLTGWLIPLIVIPVCILIHALAYIMPFIPYAVVILCFVGSCRSLSHSISLTPQKKQIVLAPLFFVVISYTFLILPLQICLFLSANFYKFPPEWAVFTLVLYVLNPLVDCLLYVFMRSDAENIIRTPHCCSRLKRVRTEMGQTTSTDVQSDHV